MHRECPLSAEQVTHITRNWSTLQDTCTDTPAELTLFWPCTTECKDTFGEYIGVKKTRDLPEGLATEARAFIRVLVQKYPFQLRAELARPMWHRFLDVWNDTGKRNLAMRAI